MRSDEVKESRYLLTMDSDDMNGFRYLLTTWCDSLFFEALEEKVTVAARMSERGTVPANDQMLVIDFNICLHIDLLFPELSDCCG